METLTQKKSKGTYNRLSKAFDLTYQVTTDNKFFGGEVEVGGQ